MGKCLVRKTRTETEFSTLQLNWLQQFIILKRRKAMLKQNGFTLVELMVVVAIFTIILTAGFIVLLTGQSAWSTTDTQIRLQENLRQISQRVARELQESGIDADGNLQVTI